MHLLCISTNPPLLLENAILHLRIHLERTAVPIWGQITQILSRLPPQRDCSPNSPERVKAVSHPLDKYPLYLLIALESYLSVTYYRSPPRVISSSLLTINCPPHVYIRGTCGTTATTTRSHPRSYIPFEYCKSPTTQAVIHPGVSKRTAPPPPTPARDGTHPILLSCHQTGPTQTAVNNQQ